MSAQPTTWTPVLNATHAVMSDGYRLPYRCWAPQDEPCAVLLALHGMNDYCNAFDCVGRALAREGVVTYAYDQRGFGLTAFRGLWPGPARLAADARAMAALMRRAYPGLPLYLAGESMGAAVMIVACGSPEPPEAEGVVLLAPAVWGRDVMDPVRRAMLWALARMLPGLRFTGTGRRLTSTDNVAVLEAQRADPLRIRRTRIDTLQGVVDLMDQALARVPRLRVPALILLGARDAIIPPRPTCRMLEHLPAPPHGRWRLALYPQGHHLLTRDLQGMVVLQDIAAWLRDRTAPLPSGCEAERAEAQRMLGGGR
jgi:acylglycerol lipase